MAKKRKIVLIIDDDEKSVNEIKTFLEDKGYSVFYAGDGELALQIIQEQVPDLILLDIIMPRIDGFTVAKQIRYNALSKNVPIVVFSAKDGMKELFAIEGITDYIVKPVNLAELLECVRSKIGQ